MQLQLQLQLYIYMHCELKKYYVWQKSEYYCVHFQLFYHFEDNAYMPI